jgi:hypothetical protein
VNDLEFNFRSLTEAETFGAAYIKDEDGCYFTVDERPNGRFYVNLFEEDGYQINRPAPRIVCTSKVTAPRRMAHAHLG